MKFNACKRLFLLALLIFSVECESCQEEKPVEPPPKPPEPDLAVVEEPVDPLKEAKADAEPKAEELAVLTGDTLFIGDVGRPDLLSSKGVTSEELASELIAYCREHLAGYKAPKSIDFEESLPRQATGKLYKRELRDRYWQGRDRQI